MKLLLKCIAIGVAALLVLVFALNTFVRVSDSSNRSVGLVEKFLFGRSIGEILAPPWSEDYKRWDSASAASASVADLLQKFGVRDLTLRNDLAEQRAHAEQMSKLAFERASAVSRAYLAASNADLPDAYFEHFIPAMDSWWHGFTAKDTTLVQQGISNYNAFLVWFRSHDRSDFKAMR